MTTPANAGGEGKYASRNVRVYKPGSTAPFTWAQDDLDAENVTAELNRLLDRERTALAAVRELRGAVSPALKELSALAMNGDRVRLCEALRTALDSTKGLA